MLCAAPPSARWPSDSTSASLPDRRALTQRRTHNLAPRTRIARFADIEAGWEAVWAGRRPAGLQLGQIPEESDSRTTSALPPLAPAEGYEHRIVRDSVPAPCSLS